MLSVYRQAAGSLSRASDVLLLVVRVIVGLLFIDHGLHKYQAKGGLAAFEGFLHSLNHVPAPGLTSQVVPALEVAGGALLIVGLLTRVIALILAAEMVFTGFVVKLADLGTGVVNSMGAGAEVDFVYLAVLLVALVLGPGRASLDAILGMETESASATSPLVGSVSSVR